MAVTLHDIARATGFSIPTVSRVLTNSSYPVNVDTRQRILEAAKTLGYRPNLAARSLRTERSNAIGVLVDDIVSPFAPLLVRGIQDCLIAHGYSCQIVNSDWNLNIEREAIHGLLDRPVDGIIFAEYSHRAVNARLEESGKPYVFVHRLFGSHIPNSVVPDDAYGAQLAIRHLLRLGHRTIAYIDGIEDWHSARQRLAGYRAGLAEAGVPIDPALMQVGDWELEGGAAGTRRLMENDPQPTAIFAANDVMALGAIYALQSLGIRVPEDVAIVGYDNRDFTRLFRPRITTVSMPVYEMGYAAAEMLLQHIVGGSRDREEMRIKGKLFVRESCGAPLVERTQEGEVTITDVRRLLLQRQPES